MLHGLAAQLVAFQQNQLASQQWGARLVFDVFAGPWQAEADPEFRTCARTTFHADFAAHLLDDAPRDDQAQASAAGLPAERVVGLAEGFEQGGQVLVGQADAGILHADAQLGAAVALVFEHGAHHDAA